MVLAQMEGRPLLAGITASCCLGFMLFGYDQGVFGGLLSNPSFLETFDNPGTEMQSQIVSTYTLGCIFGAITSLFTGGVLGRKRSILFGVALLTIGGVLQATAYTLPHMIIGRIVSGLGIGLNTTSIPMWQSETCRPNLRGKLIALQLACLVFGFVITNWMNFGFTYLPNHPISWRFPLGFQSLLAIGTGCFVPFLVESPRWLCLRDRHEEALAALARLYAKPASDPEVREQLEIMIETINEERAEGQIGWRDVFHNGSQQTFRRICLGAGANVFQQFGGNNIVAYYMPVVLERSFGFSPRMALILSSCNSMQWMFWSCMMLFVIERWGRVKLMFYGCAGMAVCFAVMGIGLGVGGKVASGFAVAFIFIFYIFYGMSLMSIGFIYPSEINGNRSRSIGAAIAMITNWLGVYTVVSVTPIGIQNLEWRFYIIFAAINVAFLPFIWFFYVETAGLSLEEIDRVFVLKHTAGSGLSYEQATKKAREELELQRLEIRAQGEKSGIVNERADHMEDAV